MDTGRDRMGQGLSRVTIRDVADAAGVSASAVSRVLSGAVGPSAATRAKVEAAAERLGYRPSALARALVGERTGLVALVVGRRRSAFDSLFIEALAEGLADRGRQMLLLVTPENGGPDEALLQALDYKVDAAVVAAGTMSLEASARFAALRVPLILSGRVLEAPGVDCVLADNRDGARQAGELLSRLGCRRIGYLGFGGRSFSDRERAAGLAEALDRAGHGLFAGYAVPAAADGALDAAVACLSAPVRPDALFCANDALAFAVLQAATALGLSVPGELCVVGFDDVPMAAWPGFSLTTVAYPLAPAIAAILDRLEARSIAPDLPAAVLRIGTRLVVRRTTRGAPAASGGITAAGVPPVP